MLTLSSPITENTFRLLCPEVWREARDIAFKSGHARAMTTDGEITIDIEFNVGSDSCNEHNWRYVALYFYWIKK